VRWRGGVSASGAASDHYGGQNRAGWLPPVAPRLPGERPPAAIAAWAWYEPSLVRVDPETLPDSGSQWQLAHQGALGIVAGGAGRSELSISGRRRYSVDPVRSELAGLAEHVETVGEIAGGYGTPDLGHLQLRFSAMEVRFPGTSAVARRVPAAQPLDAGNPLRPGDYDRGDATLEVAERLFVKSTVGLKVGAWVARLPHPPEGIARDERGGSLAGSVDARLTPGLALAVSGGPTLREDPASTVYFPVDATLTADVGRRLQAELHAGTHLEDSLWRENHQVQVSAASLKLTASALDVLDLSAWGGATQDHYPTAEAQAAGGAPLSRDDLLLTAGGSVALHPGRLRVSASYDHSERQSSYPGLAWKENRCVFTAFAIW